MNKLLRSNFARVFKMKSFWVSAVIILVYPFFSLFDLYTEMTVNGDMQYFYEETLWSVGPLLSLIMSVLVHLFIGTDYRDNTIRNKLIVGHTKTRIYVSDFITMMAVTLILYAVWIIVCCTMGMIFLSNGNSLRTNIIIGLQAGIAMLLMTAILTIIQMFMSAKISAGVISVIGCFMLLFAGVWAKTRMAETEYVELYKICQIDENGNYITDGYEPDENGEVDIYQLVKNPDYIPDGQAKDMLKLVLDTSVGAQLLDINDNHEIGLKWYFVFDSVLIVAIIGGGSLLYKRKDIN